jgi:hypothetical protein
MRILGIVLGAILLFVGAILIVVGQSTIAELRGGLYGVGGFCIACALIIFSIRSGAGSLGVGAIGAAVLGALVFFFVVLLSKG